MNKCRVFLTTFSLLLFNRNTDKLYRKSSKINQFFVSLVNQLALELFNNSTNRLVSINFLF